jgi:virulence-associated protein VagC
MAVLLLCGNPPNPFRIDDNPSLILSLPSLLSLIFCKIETQQTTARPQWNSPEGGAAGGPLTTRLSLASFDVMPTMTRIVRQGNSMTLHIPKEFQIPSTEEEIHRTPSGLMIVDPPMKWNMRDALTLLRGKQKKSGKKVRTAAS